MKTESRGEYFDPRGMRLGSGEASTSPNTIIRVIKSIVLRLACHLTKMEDGMSIFKIFHVTVQERDL